MKHLFKILLASILLLPSKVKTEVFDLNQITYESLQQNAFTDHVRAFRALFDFYPIASFLEFGLGLGTKFFLDHCDQVTSIELLVKNRHSFVIPWYCDCLDLFKNYSNWSPRLHVFSNRVNEANDLAIRNLNPELYNSDYLREIDSFFDELFQNSHFDLAFVDPGMHIRGDLVNALFNRVEIIAAHDTNFNSASYGWYKIQTPENYEKISCNYGSGITFWVSKEKKDLIHYLKTKLQ